MIQLNQQRLLALADNPACSPHLSDEECRAMAQELLDARQQLATPVRLPVCSSSPVCEIEAGYAAGVNDSKEAIRRAGYLTEGDD